MIFTYNKKAGLVIFISETINEIDRKKFAYADIKPTKQQLDEIEQNYILYIKDDKLITEKPDRIKQENINKNKEKIKDKIRKGTATPEEINKLLLEI